MNIQGSRIASGRTIDPITLEIIAGTIESTRREMEAQIERTARSVVIREGRDYRAGVFDRHGRNVSSASGAAHVDPILANYSIDEIQDGDVFIWNDPFKSGGGLTHLPDLCVTQPVIWRGELVAYVQAFGHVTDIGGLAPGSVTISATDIHQEGIIIPPVKIMEAGKIVTPLYKTIVNNSRYPGDVQGDLDAFIMTTRLGVQRVKDLFDTYGPAMIDAGFEEILESCARALREVAFPQIPDGDYPFEDVVEIAGAVPAEPRRFIPLKVTLRKRGDSVEFDFEGTGAQSKAALNIAGDERFYVKYIVSIFRTLVPDTVFNGGAVRAISCKLPEGSIISARYPASASCRAYTLFRLPELCLGALSRALGGETPGSSDTRSTWGIATLGDHGERIFFRDGIGGGGGGRRGSDGSDALNGNVRGRSRPVEFMEAFYPLIVEEEGLRTDSGGAGEYRGGLGVYRRVRFLRDGAIHVVDDRLQTQPWGVHGGKAGAGTSYCLNPGADNEHPITCKIDARPVKAGELIEAKTCGGGGWGHPFDRPVEKVAADVALGLVSAEAARDVYGVALSTDFIVDAAATEALRADRPATVAMFDRGDRFARLEAAGDVRWTAPQ
ncbi:hydantoinase B/oxoprolinase family protein [Sphingomonas crocodyli]|uniref:Hydantoinase B/oxoprolinase family protein n=1 Tax=Sphingomonas crocodyli TaxID=1979270 RepID=A0A437M062_9SPHN|nr:hydantoinase B/oxoprolinase family protein [Sphingomonas crocodyli]RVT90966.1 hydantoinase B/oxoprolinase family protein [Sphingomonas crocodyli]